MAHDYRTALADLGLELLRIPPAGKYLGVNIIGDVAYVSGHIGWRDGKPTVTGILGDTLTVEQGQIAARDAALTALGTLEDALGSLDRVTAITRVFGMVRATSDFAQHPAVIDGASKLLHDVLGPEVAPHARSAVGMSSLPLDGAVEIELTVLLKS